MKSFAVLPLLTMLAFLGLAETQGSLDSTAARSGATETRRNLDYALRERGPHQRVWSKTTWSTNSAGEIHRDTVSYTELATGMYYSEGGALREATEQIEIQAQGGGLAQRGQHKVYFPGDIYNETFELTTPDSQRLVSRPLGLTFSDGAHNVFIAELKEGNRRPAPE